MPIGSELKVLRIVKSLRQANKWQIADEMKISPDYAEYLCMRLVLDEYLEKSGGPSVSRIYTLTAKGEKVV